MEDGDTTPNVPINGSKRKEVRSTKQPTVKAAIETPVEAETTPTRVGFGARLSMFTQSWLSPMDVKEEAVSVEGSEAESNATGPVCCFFCAL